MILTENFATENDWLVNHRYLEICEAIFDKWAQNLEIIRNFLEFAQHFSPYKSSITGVEIAAQSPKNHIEWPLPLWLNMKLWIDTIFTRL
jgi:hypothetical protein